MNHPQPKLTQLESDVMAAVWAAGGEGVVVRAVVEAINADREKPLAYNTVQTIMNILVDKRILKRAKTGRAHQYTAIVSRDAVSRSMIGDFVERLFGGEVQPLLHQLIQESDLDASELRELRKWVNAKLRDTKGD